MQQSVNGAPGLSRHRWWILLIIALAFGVRLYRLADQSFWFDEAFTWYTSSVVPPADFVTFLLPFGAYTPVFYLLMRGVSLVGTSEFVLRFPAVFFGVLSIPAIERVGRRVGGPRVGRVAALLLAINPFHVWWSQDARMYSILMFCTLVAMDGFMRAIDGRGWRRSILASGAAYLFSYVTLFIGYIQLVWWLPRMRPQARLFRQWFASHLIAVAPLIPWFLLYFSQPVRGLAIGWIPKPSPAAPLLTVWNFTAADIETWTLPVLGLAALVAVLVGWGLRGRPRWGGLLLAWVLVPMLSAYLLSLRVPSYLDRYFSFSQPAWLVLIALGLAALKDRRTAWLAGGLIVGLMLINTARLHTDPHYGKEDWRSTAALLDAGLLPGDQIGVPDAESVIALSYYRRGTEPLAVIDLARDPDQLDRLAAESNRLWLVYHSTQASNHRLGAQQLVDPYTQADAATQRWLARNCREPMAEHHFTAMTVLVCAGSGAP